MLAGRWMVFPYITRRSWNPRIRRGHFPHHHVGLAESPRSASGAIQTLPTHPRAKSSEEETIHMACEAPKVPQENVKPTRQRCHSVLWTSVDWGPMAEAQHIKPMSTAFSFRFRQGSPISYPVPCATRKWAKKC